MSNINSKKNTKAKLHSTTFWLAIISILLIPLSWITEYILKMQFLHYMVDNNLSPNELEHLFISIPMGPIVTLSTLAVSVYGARRAGREISTNLKVNNNSSTSNLTNESSSRE